MPTQTSPHDADTLGRRIRQARSRAGLYQRELAAKIGVTTAHLCRVERDRVAPSAVLVGKIAKACEVDVDELAASAA